MVKDFASQCGSPDLKKEATVMEWLGVQGLLVSTGTTKDGQMAVLGHVICKAKVIMTMSWHL